MTTRLALGLVLCLAVPSTAQYIPTPVDTFPEVGTELNRVAVRLSMQNLLNGGTTYGVLTVQNSVGQTAYSIKTATGIQVAYGEITAPTGRFTGTGQTTHSLTVSSSILLGNISAPESNGSLSYSQTGNTLYVSTLAITMGAWVPWTPFTAACCGFSTVPTVIARYTIIGKTVICRMRTTTYGTSNATTFTLTLPVAARTTTNDTSKGWVHFRNNGADSTTPGLIETASGSTTATLYTTWDGQAWTNVNGKGADFVFEYETN